MSASVICIGGIKGGGGKTTLATNLAILRARDGYHVLLVDADSQGNASDFTALRASRCNDDPGYECVQLSNMAVKTQVQRLKFRYDTILIDAGGRDTVSQRAALTVAKTFVVPFMPRSFDIWTLPPVLSLIREQRPVNPTFKTLMLLNGAYPVGRENEEALAILRERIKDEPHMTVLESMLVERKAFANAAAQGLAVTESRPLDLKAVQEITEIYNAVFGGTKVV